MIDRTKFFERPGDSEGFTHEQAFAEQGISFADEHNGTSWPVSETKLAVADHLLKHTVGSWAEADMPWCDACQSYHSDKARHITRQDDRRARPGGAVSDRHDASLRALTDTVLEETFQAWMKASTLPSNITPYRQQLRRRIEQMVEKAGYGSPRDIVDLSRLS